MVGSFKNIVILAAAGILIILKYVQTYIARPKSKSELDYKERWTFKVLFILHHLVFAGALIEFVLWHQNLNVYISTAGLVIFAFSLVFREWVIRTMKEYWTIHIEIKKNQILLKEGPFKYMRHPAYFSLFVEIIGFPLIFNAYYTLLLAIIFYFPFIVYRIYLEEVELLKKFHREYARYMVTNMAVFPFSKKSLTIPGKSGKIIKKLIKRW